MIVRGIHGGFPPLPERANRQRAEIVSSYDIFPGIVSLK